MSMGARLENPIIRSPKFEGEPRGMVKAKVNADVAAAGSTVADAAAIYPGFTEVTDADDAKGVIMQNGVPGDIYIIKVADGADLKIYPPTGAAINALSANGAITVADDVCLMVIQKTATRFVTLPLLPS